MTPTAPTPSPLPAAWPQTRAILLLADGRAVVLARGNVLLAPGVVEAVAASLEPAGQAAWLTAAEFRHPGGRPRLRRLRQVIEGAGTWDAAAAAFIGAWMARTPVSPLPPRKKPEGSLEAEAIGSGEDLKEAAPLKIPPYLRPSRARTAQRHATQPPA